MTTNGESSSIVNEVIRGNFTSAKRIKSIKSIKAYKRYTSDFHLDVFYARKKQKKNKKHKKTKRHVKQANKKEK